MRSCSVSIAGQQLPGAACLKMKGPFCFYRQHFPLLQIIDIADRLPLVKILLNRKAIGGRGRSTSFIDCLDNRDQTFLGEPKNASDDPK